MLQARTVLADLTGLNPNVMYEVGLAHALGIPSFLISNSLDDLPFDLRALRVLEYDQSDSAWASRLSDRITAGLQQALQSPETSVPSAFLNPSRSPHRAEGDQDIARLKQEVRRLEADTRSKRRARYDLHDIELLVRRYVAKGYDDGEILSRMYQRGVNPKFVLQVLRRVRVETGGPDGEPRNPG
jgi:cytochrome P450